DEWGFLLARKLAGGGAASWVAFTVMYTNFIPPEKVTAAMGSISFIIVSANNSSWSLTRYIVCNFGLNSPFYLADAFSLTGLILAFFINEREKQNESSKPMHIKDVPAVIKNTTLIKTAILSVIAHSIMFATIFGFMPNVALSIGFHESTLFLVVSSFMLPHAIATFLVGNVILSKLVVYYSLLVSYFIVFIVLFLTH